MAPRTINDDAALLKIALIYLDQPTTPFAAVEREAFAMTDTHCHSDDSRRRRLYRKFNANPDHWMQKARDQRRQEKAEQTRIVFENMAETLLAVGQAVNRFRDRFGPMIDLAIDRLNQPETRAAMANLAKAVEQMQRRKTITLQHS